MKKSNDLVKLAIPSECFFKESDAAYGFQFESGGTAWLPKSRSEDFEKDAEFCTLWIEYWLVEKNGLEVFVDSSHEPTLFE